MSEMRKLMETLETINEWDGPKEKVHGRGVGISDIDDPTSPDLLDAEQGVAAMLYQKLGWGEEAVDPDTLELEVDASMDRIRKNLNYFLKKS